MRRAIRLHPLGSWPEPKAEASVTLAWQDRHRRRYRLLDDDGKAFLLDLADVPVMADGDGLELDGGGWILIRAAAEDLIEVTAPTAADLARIAWHVGNRHMPVEVRDDGGLRLPWDHVLADMIFLLGGAVVRLRAPFHPEGGAYAKKGDGAAHGHDDHGHDHHDHDHHDHHHHHHHDRGHGQDD